MKNIVYIRETRYEDHIKSEVFTTLKHVIQDLNVPYMTAYNVLTKGKPFIYGNITIKRTTLKHYSQDERRKI